MLKEVSAVCLEIWMQGKASESLVSGDVDLLLEVNEQFFFGWALAITDVTPDTCILMFNNGLERT